MALLHKSNNYKKKKKSADMLIF